MQEERGGSCACAFVPFHTSAVNSPAIISESLATASAAGGGFVGLVEAAGEGHLALGGFVFADDEHGGPAVRLGAADRCQNRSWWVSIVTRMAWALSWVRVEPGSSSNAIMLD